MYFVFVVVGAISVVILILAFLLNADAFDDVSSGDCTAGFSDQALLLAALSALVLTTPWNIAITNIQTSKLLIVTLSVPLTLLLLYATIITLALNGAVLVNGDEVCGQDSGRIGVYAALVWLGLFNFLHTTLLGFYKRYQEKLVRNAA